MLAYKTTHKRPCRWCMGYGLIDEDDSMIECPRCHSIAPQAFLPKLGSTTTPTHTYIVRSWVINLLLKVFWR